MRFTLLIQRLRRQRAAGRRDPYRSLSEPLVPTLRDWPVARQRR